MSLKLTRRGFLKASAVASGSALLLGASAGSALAEGEEQGHDTDEIIKIPSACRQCYGRCPIIGYNKGGKVVEDEHGWHVEGGRLIKIEGNPDFVVRNAFRPGPDGLPTPVLDENGNEIPFFAEGTLCSRAFAITQEIYNPTRVRYPQMRVGERGEGKWKRVSWDEAIKGACDGFKEIGEKYGWYTIAHQYGTGRDSQQFQSMNRLWLEQGSTSTFGVGNLCWLGSYFTSQRIYGDECQYTGWDGNNTKAILIWCRQERSRGYYDWLTMKRAQDRGAKIILVDPRFTCTASKADLWLPIRPGSDMALVLFFINTIMHSEKCDTEFARYFTNAPFFIDEKTEEFPNATGYQLRQNMIAGMEETGNVELYPVYDEISGKIVYWNGDTYAEKKNPEAAKKAFQYLDENGEIAGEWIVMEDGPDKGKMLGKVKPALTTPDGKGRKIGNRTYRTAWDILLEHVTPWTAERAAELCELPVEKVEEAINIYLEASPGACFCRGQKVEFSINTSGISQAFTIMMALAGNFDVPGGQNIGREPATGFEPSMFDIWPMTHGHMSEERLATARDIMNRSVCGGVSCNPQEIWQANDETGELEKVMQNAGHQNILGLQGGFGAALAKGMTDGVEPVTGAPKWNIHGLFMETSEPILSIERGDVIEQGMKNLDMFVMIDMYMTPSGELADYVLPAAHPNEVPRLEWAHSGHGYPTSHTTLIRQPLVEPLGEAKDDIDINFMFGKEFGTDMYWADKWEWFDFQLQGPASLPAPLKLTYPKLQEYVYLTGPQMTDRFKGLPKYKSGAMRKSGDFRPGFNTMFRGNKQGPVYRTPEIKVDTPAGPKVVAPAHPQSDNGKLELWSEDLFLYGNGPLPMYIEPPVTKFSRPDLLEEYPYELITGGRSHAFFHTEYRNSPWMREVHMFPTCQFNPETAAAHGIEQDDWVWIETPWGKIRQRADITNSIKPGTVHVEHDWWFPEREATDQLHGAYDSNCNILFSNDGPYDPAVGTDNYGGLCKIYKAEEGAPEGICMNAKDLEVFLPLTEETLASDTQDDGIVWPTLKKEGK